MTHNKIIALFLSLYASSFAIELFANEANIDSTSIVDIINSCPMSTIEIIQPEELNNRILDIVTEQNDSSQHIKSVTKVIPGKQISYKILAFNKANQHNQAITLSQQINAKFPRYRTTVKSNLPYWQVWVERIFFNEEDAQQAINELKHAFPNQNMTIRKMNIIVTK